MKRTYTSPVTPVEWLQARRYDEVQQASIKRSEAYLRKKAAEAERSAVFGEETIQFCLGALTACVLVAIAVTLLV